MATAPLALSMLGRPAEAWECVWTRALAAAAVVVVRPGREKLATAAVETLNGVQLLLREDHVSVVVSHVLEQS